MIMRPARPCIDVGIFCRNIAKSLAFYVDILGLDDLGHVDFEFGRLYRLKFGDSFVKLISPKNELPSPTKGFGSALGLQYITFPITNLDEICERCAANDVAFESAITQMLPGLFIAMIEDPDGNVLELLERR